MIILIGVSWLILTYPEVWIKLNVCMLQLHSLDCRQDLSPLNIVPCYFTQKQIVLVIYCCITDYLKINSLKQTDLLPHHFCGSGVQTWHSWVLCFRVSHRLQSRCWPMSRTYLNTWLGKNLLESLLTQLLTGLNSLYCVNGRLNFLLDVRGSSQFLSTQVSS